MRGIFPDPFELEKEEAKRDFWNASLWKGVTFAQRALEREAQPVSRRNSGLPARSGLCEAGGQKRPRAGNLHVSEQAIHVPLPRLRFTPVS